LNDALDAAQAGFRIWKEWPALSRSRVLWRAAANLRENIGLLARAITAEQGKILSEAHAEAQFSIEVLEWYAAEAARVYGRIIPSRSHATRFMVLKEPVGPVAAFVSWNFPATNVMRKVAGALAAGCSIVIKPAEETPASANIIAQAFCDAGLPDGVLGVVFGNPDQVSSQLLNSPITKAVTFTGSTRVGRLLQTLATPTLKRCTLELGGHAPVIVHDDASIDEAVRLSCIAKYRNAGQACVSPSRFLVMPQVYDVFLEGFTKAAQALNVGPGTSETSSMGPVFSQARLSYMQSLTTDAVAQGARLVAGGHRVDREGFYFQPTVLANVPTTARIMNEEPFGPIAIINRVTDLDEAICEANRLPVGLGSYAFARDSAVKNRLVRELDSGLVILNSMVGSLAETPFGGIKESGYGLEGGSEGIEAFLQNKFVSDTQE
jgi:succinate-semialdehyde dehydrogenase/glutarate-semialdehyde dehydrogenase